MRPILKMLAAEDRRRRSAEIEACRFHNVGPVTIPGPGVLTGREEFRISASSGALTGPSPAPWAEGTIEELELSPVQTQIWNEYDEAVRERRDRLARAQRRIAARIWLRKHRYGLMFWLGLAAFMGLEFLALHYIARAMAVHFF